MDLPTDWRSPACAEDYAKHDFADFAQEFLRRNPDYQSDYEEAGRGPPKGDKTNDPDMIAKKWGLVFRRRSHPRASVRTSLVGARGQSLGSRFDAGETVRRHSDNFARPSTADLHWASAA